MASHLLEGALKGMTLTGKAKAINILLTHHSGIYLSKALQQRDQQQLSKAGPVPGPFLSWHFNVKRWDKELRISIL